MRHPRPPHARGLTLLELLISMSIMLAAIAAATSVLLAGTNLTAVAERRGGAEDAARMAMDAIARSAQNAGLGAAGGLWVIDGSGARRLVSPIYGTNGPTADDLWLVVADPNSFREPCQVPGASVANHTSGSGPLQVGCIANLAVGDTLVATNWQTGALLVLTSTDPIPPTIHYQGESSPSFSDDPNNGGFKSGDRIFRVRILHYFVKKDASGRPSLYAATGTIANDITAGPFSDSASVQLVQSDIEDLQITYGVAPASPDYSFNPGFSADTSPTTLRALKVTVVSRTAAPQRMQDGQLRDYRPLEVEDNVPADTTPDGYERVVYSRRIELPNLSAGNL